MVWAARTGFAADDAGQMSAEELMQNDAQFTCMNRVMDALDEPKLAKPDFFERFPVKRLPDGSYNVLVTYDLSGKHQVSCTLKKDASGSWTLVETRELK